MHRVLYWLSSFGTQLVTEPFGANATSAVYFGFCSNSSNAYYDIVRISTSLLNDFPVLSYLGGSKLNVFSVSYCVLSNCGSS